MKIRHVSVKNFRGIRELDWDIKSNFICLIGPGDSTKTTILDAITYALGPSRLLGLNDADFYQANTDEPILIEVTVTHVPPRLMIETSYGLFLRGWSAEHGLLDDPDPVSDAALTIELHIDDALEPRWTVTKGPESKPVSWRDRAALQLFRIGDRIDTHLAWGRGSALLALTASSEEVDSTLTAALRRAREAAFAAPHEKLNTAAATAYRHAVELGIPEGTPFRPGLAPGAMMGAPQLVLHQGNVPLSNAGSGTRQLVALALQQAGISEGSVVLIDEVEHGLEPHRLLHLLQSLRQAVAKADKNIGLGQVFLTTHSADAVAELRVDEIHVVRSSAGGTAIQRAPDAFNDGNEIDPQAITRAGAPALLARRVIVAEGKTEVGYLRAMASLWHTTKGIPIAHLGTTSTDGGGGDNAATRAIGFARLGYETALFVDSDRTLNPPAETVSAQGVRVIQWADKVSIEERVARDLPEEDLKRLVQLAISLTEDEEGVLSAIKAQLPNRSDPIPSSDPQSWIAPEMAIDKIREAIGKAANKKKWFKTIDNGEYLGALVAELLPKMAKSDTAAKTDALRSFAYGE